MEDLQKAFTEFLADVLEDKKRDSNFKNIIIAVLIALLLVAIISMVGLGIYTQNKLDESADRSEKRMYEFLSEYDFTNSIDIDTGTITDSHGSGYVNFNAR